MKPEFLLSGIGFMATIAAIFVFWGRLPPQIPLFYSKPWGQEQIAPNVLIFLPTALSFLFFTINIFLGKFFADPFVKKALLAGGATVLALAAITTIRIIFLVL